MLNLFLVILGGLGFRVVLEKFGLFEWIQINTGRENLLNKMAKCRFCRSFWCGVVFCVVCYFLGGNYLFKFINIPLGIAYISTYERVF